MKGSNSLKEVCDLIVSADSVLIFPHIQMDGDTFGSSTALCRGLRAAGKTAYVLLEDKIPGYLSFLDDGLCTYDQDIIKEPDLCVGVDCADIERFVLRRKKFTQGKKTLNVDHHKTSKLFADFSYIDVGAAAAGEMIYNMLVEMGIPIDRQTGEGIYAAILTDTGNYQYSNTNEKSHLITVDLFNKGIDHGYVNRMLYQNTRIEKLHISGKILSTLKMMAGNKAVMAYVTRDMLKEVGALMEDTEGVSEMLRDIGGVELSLFAKETGNSETKFSMRSKTWVDCTELSLKYDGGGHSKAAGCTIGKPIFEAAEMIEADVEEYFARAGVKND